MLPRLPDITSPGDIGAAGLCYTLGYAAASILWAGSVDAGVVAGVCAVGGLGVKNSVQAFRGFRRAKVQHQARRQQRETLPRLVEDLLSVDKLPLIDKRRLAWRRSLWSGGLLSDEELKATIVEVTEKVTSEDLR